MEKVKNISLNDQNKIPQLGFGVWQVGDSEATSIVNEALRVGYRHIDTASIYRNETGVGLALKNSGLKRDEVFVTTKLWNDDQGKAKAMPALRESLKKLQLEYADLYLVHWPSPHRGLYLESWKELVAMKKSGLVRSIGVSNFCISHLQEIIDATGEVPVLNQVELHPQFQQKELRAFHLKHGIRTECWSPLGQGKILENSVLTKIASKHSKSVAQVILRWHMHSDLIAIPKSATPSRIKENFEIFDFALDSDDMSLIESLDSKSGRIGPDPMTAEF